MILGAPKDDDILGGSGAAYIYFRNEGGTDNWGLQTKAKASDAAIDDWLGHSVSINGDYAIASAVFEGDFEGAVYAYLRSEASWSQVSKTKPTNFQADDWFGFSICLNQELSVIGSAFASLTPFSESGTAYIYENLGDLSLPVELISFTASISDGNVCLKWETASELNNIGFAVLRSDQQEGEYTKLADYNDFDTLRGLGISAFGQDYSYVDNSALEGNQYWYKIVDNDYNGMREAHGPISVYVNSDSELLPKKISLSSNYPNPFNSTTTFKLEIPQIEGETTKLSINIYNVVGKKVRTIYHGVIAPGGYSFEWDGTNEQGNAMSSGMYIYTVSSFEFSQAKKMILLK